MNKIPIAGVWALMCATSVNAEAMDFSPQPVVAPVGATPCVAQFSPISKREAREHHHNAMLLADAGKTKEAILEDQEAIAGDPNHPGYHVLLARLLIDNGQLEHALQVYEFALNRFPELRDDLRECVLQLRGVVRWCQVDRDMSRAQTAAELAPVFPTAAPAQPIPIARESRPFNHLSDPVILAPETAVQVLLPSQPTAQPAGSVAAIDAPTLY
jgi:tetratricopeptide (TPR) repeat protein